MSDKTGELIKAENFRKGIICSSIAQLMPEMFGKTDRWYIRLNEDDNGMPMKVTSGNIMSVSVYCNDILLAWQSLNGDSPAQMAIDIMSAVSRAMDK